MPSGEFHSYPISLIHVAREARQRRELTGIDELAESIQRLGLINPVVVTRAGELVAGERRLMACKSLGHTSILIHYADELSKRELRMLELEENTKRVDLTWQDQCRATEELHELYSADNPTWSQDNTADAIGVDRTVVTKHLTVAKELSNPKIANAPLFSTALGIVQRTAARKKSSILSDIRGDAREVPLLNVDFNRWASIYTGPKFNFIHCDFPYGINASNQQQGTNIAMFTAYEDDPATYWKLLATLKGAMSNVVAESAHLMFWFSMSHYQSTLTTLTDMGWKVDPFPLLWHKSDNLGLLPDPKRGPRRVYETAFLGARGDRHIVSAVSNTISAPTTKEIHMSEKPRNVLAHFFKMFVDDSTLILDPTCGSGNAIRCADTANLRFGLEKDASIFGEAKAHFFD